MKKNAIRSVKNIILISFLFFITYSCSDSTQDYLDEYQIRKMIEDEIRKNNKDLEFTQWEIVPITVKKETWEWNAEAGRYEAIYDLPELTEFIYEDGAQLGYVFIGEQGVDEVQKMMPYVQNYRRIEQGKTIAYTETISYDLQYGTPSSVAFYLQTSDLDNLKSYDKLLSTYNFRIVLVW